jgi:hypothetical protein
VFFTNFIQQPNQPMKKALIFVLLVLSAPVVSSAQWDGENAKRDSANVKLMLSNGYCRQQAMA